MVKVNDANNVTNGCWPRANLEEAWKTVKKTPEYKDYLKAEDFADEKYKAKDKAYVLLDKADKVVKKTPEYKNYKEAVKAEWEAHVKENKALYEA